MTFYLRNSDNKSIVDIECRIKNDEPDYWDEYVELNSVVVIKYFSLFLLQNLDRKEEIIQDFSNIENLRGWLWEIYFMGRQNKGDEYDLVIQELTSYLQSIAKKYNLSLVTD